MRAIQSQVCSPDAVIFGPDFAQSLYCHLLCGLLFADEVRIVSATFAHSVVLAFQTFERVWEEICADIRAGALSPTRVTAPAVRKAVSALLAAPNPALADEVARRCAALSNWYGVIPALFPNARYVHGIMTGSMEHYVKKLRHYAGGAAPRRRGVRRLRRLGRRQRRAGDAAGVRHVHRAPQHRLLRVHPAQGQRRRRRRR
jgi:auxin responsive GH3 family protein/jasmonic acid-amino synthetase